MIGRWFSCKRRRRILFLSSVIRAPMEHPRGSTAQALSQCLTQSPIHCLTSLGYSVREGQQEVWASQHSSPPPSQYKSHPRSPHSRSWWSGACKSLPKIVPQPMCEEELRNIPSPLDLSHGRTPLSLSIHAVAQLVAMETWLWFLVAKMSSSQGIECTAGSHHSAPPQDQCWQRGRIGVVGGA